jgi:calcineurin-like phosphoesterase family protein
MSYNKMKFDYANMERIWHVSDTHFGHKRMLHWSRKNMWSNIDEHDEALIDNWNFVVDKGDFVIHYGDISFHGPDATKAILDRLNGNIILLAGNHDNLNVLRRHPKIKRIEYILNLSFMYYGQHITRESLRICASHMPIWDWDGLYRGTYHIYGHTHGLSPMPIINCIDIGMDSVTDENDKLYYRPISTKEAIDAIHRRNETLIDNEYAADRLTRIKRHEKPKY